MNSTQDAKLRKVIQRYRQQPDMFVIEQLGVNPSPWQREALKALTTNQKLAIRSGHGVGKSAFLSWVIIWWVSFHAPAKVATTANTAGQLQDVLWGELSKWIRKLNPPFSDFLDLTKDRLINKLRGDVFAVARTARKENPEALQGFHSEHMLYVIDEASGVPDIIFEVAAGAIQKPTSKVIMVGNPTRPAGYFYDAFHKNRDSWWTRRVSCIDRDALGDRISPTFADDIINQYGLESNQYRVRVVGDFPDTSDTQFIPTELIERCLAYTAVGYEKMPIIMGLDPAYMGDDRTVWIIRQGRKVFKPITARKLDGVEVANKTIELMEIYNVDAVGVDNIGIGASAYDHLKHSGYRNKIHSVDVRRKSRDTKYANLRDQLYHKMLEELNQLLDLPDDNDLVIDLKAIQVDYTGASARVAKKSDIKKDYGFSPDIADALMITFGVIMPPIDAQRNIMAQPNKVIGRIRL